MNSGAESLLLLTLCLGSIAMLAMLLTLFDNTFCKEEKDDAEN